ncbi:hypothetical protein BT96DRAFT_1004980 [Gymnopus androsaceus JB14]|uniref:Uncharacterized protein n=1 Tax=Gymnopus androsaceus JB14 TaxID=1447944 RepID=A0A6A4GQW1_9AGAR|nr:hypothetical protein BT96DRAFT_1004980 [Gymnopus androsaceus JB14]
MSFQNDSAPNPSIECRFERICSDELIDPEHPCTLMPCLVALHYEISLIEAGRSLLADRMDVLLINVLERNHSSLCRELREIGKKMRDISVEGEWLEMQVAGKKYALSMVQQQHVVVSI